MFTHRYRVRYVHPEYHALGKELESSIDILQEGVQRKYLFEQIALLCRHEVRQFSGLTIEQKEDYLNINKDGVSIIIITFKWTTKN
jgi:hypothetical protein